MKKDKEVYDIVCEYLSPHSNKDMKVLELACGFRVIISIEENKKMIEEYVQNNFVKEGMIVDLAIHDESREGNQNIHAHIMTIVRP